MQLSGQASSQRVCYRITYPFYPIKSVFALFIRSKHNGVFRPILQNKEHPFFMFCSPQLQNVDFLLRKFCLFTRIYVTWQTAVHGFVVPLAPAPVRPVSWVVPCCNQWFSPFALKLLQYKTPFVLEAVLMFYQWACNFFHINPCGNSFQSRHAVWILREEINSK